MTVCFKKRQSSSLTTSKMPVIHTAHICNTSNIWCFQSANSNSLMVHLDHCATRFIILLELTK